MARLNEEHGKQFFTILDFKRATELFADKDFDGEPVQIYQPTGDDDVVPPPPPPMDDENTVIDGDNWLPAVAMARVTAAPCRAATPRTRRASMATGLVVALVRQAARTAHQNTRSAAASPWPLPVSACNTWMPTASWSESLRDFTRINLAKKYESLDAFMQAWTSADRKQALIEELQHRTACCSMC